MKQEDWESLLGDYGVRKYDADIGRFLSVDKLFQSQPGYSPYHYSYNDPVNASDPSGLFGMTAFGRPGLTDVSMGDFEQGDMSDYGSWGGTIMVPVEYNSKPDPLTPGTRLRPMSSSMNTFAASSGGGSFYQGSTPSLLNSVFLTGGSNNPVKYWPNSVQREIVVEADRVPITLGVITDAEIDRIANDFSASGSFPWNLSEVLDKSPQHALWDFKRKTDLLPYKSYWYNGAERQRDEIGNVIWGRVMASSGWPLSVALGAAGAYQTGTGASSWEFWQSNWQNLGDDPRDSRGIQLGYSNGSYAKIMTIRALQGTLNIMLGSSKSTNDFQSIHRLTTLLIFR